MSYYESEKMGRQMLIELIPRLYNQKKYDVAYYITPPFDTAKYDGFVTVLHKQGGVLANHMIEVKIRDRHYDELLLEKEKYDSLKSKCKESGADILYICTTPVSTYIFNLSKISELKWVAEEHNISTVEKKGTRMKKVTYLPIKSAEKVINITYHDIVNNKVKKEKETERIIKEKQNQRCLFEWLLTPTDLKGYKEPSGFYYKKKDEE